MSFGCGVGDFVSIGLLTWDLYKSCKGAPESFGNIASEVLSLHAILKEAEESVFAQSLSTTQQNRLKVVADGCYGVLQDLQELVKKYESLGTQGKRTWDRMKWGAEDIAGLRSRLTSNTALLTAWISMSQANVEKKLKEYVQEIRNGRREGSVISTQSIDSLSADEGQVWQTIRKELEDVGVTVSAFNANKDFIIAGIANAVASGAFGDLYSTAEPCDKSSLTGVLNGAGIVSQGPIVLEAPQPVPQSSLPNFMDPSNAAAISSRKDAGEHVSLVPLTPKVAKRRSQLAALITRLVIRPRAGLTMTMTMKEGDSSKARKILNNSTKLDLLGEKSFSTAMCRAAASGKEHFVQLLIANGADVNASGKYGSALYRASSNGQEQVVRLLLENGAHVNTNAKGRYTALQSASINGHEHVVRLLLENGADVDAQGDDGTALQEASGKGHERVVRLLLENGADVNANSNGRYTALQSASINGYEQVVRLLLEYGADINIKAGSSISALAWASLMTRHQTVRLLRQKNGAGH